MKKFTYFVLLTLLSIVFTACSQKTTIKSLKPSLVDDSAIKKISIEEIKNDDISLSLNIQSKMNTLQFNNKKYFTIINRNQSSNILKEQKLQDSGLVNVSRTKRFGLGEVESILSGSINSKEHDKNEFYEKRTNYNKCIRYEKNKDNTKRCTKYQTYNAICSNNIYTIRAFLSINKVENASILYSKNFENQKVIKDCNDYSAELPTTFSIYNLLSHEIANNFLKEISPSIHYFTVVLLEDEDIGYTDLEEKLLENSLKLISLNHLQKAEILLSKLVLSTKSKSSTAIYNLAVVKEGLGKLNEAYSLYKKAENITMINELDENILTAVKRIEKSLINNKRAMQQINN